MVNQDASQKFVKQGLTFDDVLLIPAASDVLPADVVCRSTSAGSTSLAAGISTPI